VASQQLLRRVERRRRGVEAARSGVRRPEAREPPTFGLAIADLASDVPGALVERPRFLHRAGLALEIAEQSERNALEAAMAKVLIRAKRPLVAAARLVEVAELLMEGAQIRIRRTLGVLIGEFRVDGDRPLEALAGFLEPALRAQQLAAARQHDRSGATV